MEEKMEKAEGVLRVSSMLLAAMGAATVGLDAETKTVFFLQKRATSHHPQVLWVFTIAASIAAGYHLLQFCCFLTDLWLRKKSNHGTKKTLAWTWLLLDQGVAYGMFAVTVAATQGSMVAVTGVKHMQWTKLCNIYTRFCNEIAGGLLCGFAASVAMAALSFFSARRLFKICPAYPREVLSNSNKWRWNLFYSSFN